MRVFHVLSSAILCLTLALAAAAAAQETNFATGPQYLMNYGSPLFARSIATPTLSLDEPLRPVPAAFNHGASTEHVSYRTTPGMEGQADLFPIYYGVPRVSVVQIDYSAKSAAAESAVLASWFDAGVSEVTDAETLRLRGYGITLGEYARYWRAHTRPATRRYTNDDIERLHQRS